ncbi:MAG: aminodeoxychorismate synthase component I [Gammaproteobacteria bacterium]|nr:aminodeoxychorismate synthase component I [Gammaproteobacteria bacterium]
MVNQGKIIIQRADDVVPADLLGMQAANPDYYPFYLCSSASGTDEGRYDILMAAPGERLWLDQSGTLLGRDCGPDKGRFLQALDNWWGSEKKDADPEFCLPFSGGWFVFLAYEMAAEVERVLNLEAHPDLPVAFAVRIPAAVIVDRLKNETWLVCEPECSEHLERIRRDLALANAVAVPEHVRFESLQEDSAQPYLEAVDQAKRYIASGDVYQANLARTWKAELAEPVPAVQLFARLIRSNPGPFSALARWNDTWVLSSSPERLVYTRLNRVETRPIAGTRPRGKTPEADAALMQELMSNPKERAEHVMLIDLERNDLGRVCKAGTIEVNEYMVLESYAHVHHIVSNVRGELSPGTTPGGVIAAVFPGGTITGCPKVRCMQLIHELEAGPRGAYTGSLGYLNRDGSMDLNILIRTLVKRGNHLSFSAGAGIVSDSVPVLELQETRAKAKGLVKAIVNTDD